MKALIKALTVAIFPILLGVTSIHEYYISLTIVEYSETEKSLQIISQVFIDDMETLVKNRYNEALNLDEESDSSIDFYISKYLKERLLIEVNNNNVSYNFLGKEYKDEMIHCYLEVESVEKLKSIKVKNKLFFDVFQSQQNIVRFKIKDKNKSFLLMEGNADCLLNFD